MRPVLHSDVVAAAMALLQLPEARRERALSTMLERAGAADAYRKRTGRAHPNWGNGSLMGVALPRVVGPEPYLDSPDYCRCMALVFDGLVRWRSRKAARAGV